MREPLLPGNVRVTVRAGDLLPVRPANVLLGRRWLAAATWVLLRARAVVPVVGEEGQPHFGLAQQLLHLLRQVVHEPLILKAIKNGDIFRAENMQ